MAKCLNSVTAYGQRFFKETLSARILGDTIAVDAKDTILDTKKLIQMFFTPAQFRKFCEAGLRMCDEMEGK